MSSSTFPLPDPFLPDLPALSPVLNGPRTISINGRTVLDDGEDVVVRKVARAEHGTVNVINGAENVMSISVGLVMLMRYWIQ